MRTDKIYSVVRRIRSKQIEKLVSTDNICIHDQVSMVFQSFSLEKVIQYYNSIQKSDGPYWRDVAKYIIYSPIGEEIEEGILNEEMIKSENYIY